MLLHLLVQVPEDIEKADEKKEPSDDKWKKKDIRDYSEADLEKLLEQWEEQDEPLEEDELPEWKRTPPQIDLSKLDANKPEEMLRMTKKGKTLMMFATVSGNPTEKETEQITQLWQSSLFNANVELQRYVVGANRVLFMLKDGAKAWEIKDFLVQQDRCELVTIESQDYPGKGGQSKDANKTSKSDDKTDSSKKKTTIKKASDDNKIKKEEL
ncbi:LRP chaperone MESD [Lamellibrachia satsuma]|nr:LRP chaperone MESD [Lamellibrachia satsuma]